MYKIDILCMIIICDLWLFLFSDPAFLHQVLSLHSNVPSASGDVQIFVDSPCGFA